MSVRLRGRELLMGQREQPSRHKHGGEHTMTDLDQLLQAASRSAETAKRLRATAGDADADATARLTAERNLLKLQLMFARSLMDVVIEDVRRLLDDLSTGFSFELQQDGVMIDTMLDTSTSP